MSLQPRPSLDNRNGNPTARIEAVEVAFYSSLFAKIPLQAELNPWLREHNLPVLPHGVKAKAGDPINSGITGVFEWFVSEQAYRICYGNETGIFTKPPPSFHCLQILTVNPGKWVEVEVLERCSKPIKGLNPPFIRNYLTQDEIETLSCDRDLSRQPMIDHQALQAYRRRLDQIDQELKQIAQCDFSESPEEEAACRQIYDELQEEQLRLEQEINRCLNRRGQVRDIRTSERAKARQKIRVGLNRAIAKIEERMPALGRHLRLSLPTGRNGAILYRPVCEVHWATLKKA